MAAQSWRLSHPMTNTRILSRASLKISNFLFFSDLTY